MNTINTLRDALDNKNVNILNIMLTAICMPLIFFGDCISSCMHVLSLECIVIVLELTRVFIY